MKIPYLLKATLVTSVFGFVFNSNLAFAETENTNQDTPQTEIQSVKTGDSFVSKGQTIHMENADLQFQTINDWQIRVGNNSLMMREVLPQDTDPSKTVYEVPVYNKNVQFIILNKSLPLDEKRSNEIAEYLTEKVGSNPSIRGFSIDEKKFIDVHGKNDGLLFYTSMQHKDMKMRQMHIVFGGSDQQLIATYSDLADSFESDTAAMELAWNVMTNVALEGESPSRFAAAYTYGPFALGAVIILLLLGALKSASEKRAIRAAQNELQMEEHDDLQVANASWEVTKTASNHSIDNDFNSQF